MTRINLTKYGFIRCPEEDFSDDGTKFTCYRFSNTTSHVSKCVSNGQVYLSAHVSGQLPYDIYSKLPNYQAANWTYNGISMSSLTDTLLEEFYRACVAYEKEYQDAEASTVYPSLDELTEKCHRIVGKKLLELSKLENLIAKHMRFAVLNFSDYEWKRVKDCMKNLDQEVKKFNPATYPAAVYKTYGSFNVIKPDYEAADSYWFKHSMEIFNNYGLK